MALYQIVTHCFVVSLSYLSQGRRKRVFSFWEVMLFSRMQHILSPPNQCLVQKHLAETAELLHLVWEIFLNLKCGEAIWIWVALFGSVKRTHLHNYIANKHNSTWFFLFHYVQQAAVFNCWCFAVLNLVMRWFWTSCWKPHRVSSVVDEAVRPNICASQRSTVWFQHSKMLKDAAICDTLQSDMTFFWSFSTSFLFVFPHNWHSQHFSCEWTKYSDLFCKALTYGIPEKTHVCVDNVHETSASLISRRVTWRQERGATAGASSRTKPLAQGDTAGLVPLILAPRQMGVCLLGGPGPPCRGMQHTASTQFKLETYTTLTEGAFMIRECLCINEPKSCSVSYVGIFFKRRDVEVEKEEHRLLTCFIIYWLLLSSLNNLFWMMPKITFCKCRVQRYH